MLTFSLSKLSIHFKEVKARTISLVCNYTYLLPLCLDTKGSRIYKALRAICKALLVLLLPDKRTNKIVDYMQIVSLSDIEDYNKLLMQLCKAVPIQNFLSADLLIIPVLFYIINHRTRYQVLDTLSAFNLLADEG
jgi:hypothetical protein